MHVVRRSLKGLEGHGVEFNSQAAPFPWFGGKRTVASTIWERLGDVNNYVEPFFGSGAVLLSRPHAPKTETINDADKMVANFWRAAKADPESVAHYADWPVNEADLHARHWWLLTEGAKRVAALEGDPDLYDAQVAGWWCWGACAWIGSGWCSGNGPWRWTGEEWAKGDAGMGINRQLPHMGNAGQGINRKHGKGDRLLFITEWMTALSDRLREVRVACGDWSRVCGPSATHKHGLTGVFLDPPYSDEANRDMNIYNVESGSVAHDAFRWAMEAGQNPLMRIAFAGYDCERQAPEEWTAVKWKAKGGYGSQGDRRGRDNAARETLWFSPHCLKPKEERAQRSLFEFVEGQQRREEDTA